MSSPVFAWADAIFDVRAVMDAAWFRGELQPCWSELLAGLAGADGQQATPAPDALQAISDAIRYQHELITAEETDAWLTANQLSLDDLNEFCLRRYWRTQNPNPPTGLAPAYPLATEEQRLMLLKELLFSGDFAGLAQQLAWRVASSGTDEVEGPTTAVECAAADTKNCLRLEVEPVELPETLRALQRDLGWWRSQITLEAEFVRHCGRVCTPENRGRSLATLRLPLTRFEVELMDFESADAAREACLCLTTDGLTLAELAEQEHGCIERRQCLLEELPAEHQLWFLAADRGQVRPLLAEERFQVCRIVAKAEPTLADEAVVNRVDHELLAGHFEHLVSKQVSWMTPTKPAG